MKAHLLMLSFALLAATVGAAPAAPPTKCCPSGSLLLLPSHLENSAPVDFSDSQKTQSDESQPERLLDSGEYYVLLPDGRLQMVKYTTAALREDQEPQTQEFQQSQQFQQQQLQQQGALHPELQYVQFPLPGSQYTQTKLEYKTPELKQKAEDLEEEPKTIIGFEANVEYRDVKPISAPIYAYNPTPLVRILKR
ncbi:hypothetical protein J6590_053261 [Homalodisca vitripennis]|nr:hypothetical protein J6590_053261 [Homalodisca vitripennis]